MTKKVLILAGEVSGDLHGSNLVRAMKSFSPDLEFFGIGGDRMRKAGVDLLYHIDQISLMGFVEVLRHIPSLRKIKERLLSFVRINSIDAIVLIDYPGFNLSFAKSVSEFCKKVYYYISPQLWAWGKNRIEIIKKHVQKMIVVFPFEEELYRKHGIDATFVGHPLIDVIENYEFIPRELFFNYHNLDKNKKLLVVFPGSRIQEIKNLLSPTLNAVEKLKNEFDLNVVIAGVKSIEESLYLKFTQGKVPIIYDSNYELLKYGDLGVIKSGTSTLEAAILQIPFVVIYRTSFLSYLISKSLIQIDKISLANILAEEKIVDELIQYDCTEKKIYNKVKDFLLNPEKADALKQNLKKVKELLGKSGASVNAAWLILSEIL